MTDDPVRWTPDDLLDQYTVSAIRLGLMLGLGMPSGEAIEEYRKSLAGPRPADACWCRNEPSAECGCDGPQVDGR